MKTLRCRNCGISYQSTATICLRCMNPLEKSEGKTEELGLESSVSPIQNETFSDGTKKAKSDLETYTGLGKLLQHASPRPSVIHKAIEDTSNSESDIISSKSEPFLTQEKISSTQLESEQESSLAELNSEHSESPTAERKSEQESFFAESNHKQVEIPSTELESEKDTPSSEPDYDNSVQDNQSILNQLERDLNIHSISENDIFTKNGYLITDGNISHLNLSNVKIEKVPSEIYQLKSLRILNLSGTIISDLFPNISDLQNLN